MKRIVLASASPRRKELLENIGVKFQIIKSNFEEDIDTLIGGPEEKARSLALGKARDVARNLTDGIVIGADTIVVLNNRIYGKPSDKQDAFGMLSKLSDNEHYVITGVVLIDAGTGREIIDHEKTKVVFNRLSEEKINKYISTGECFGKAGAYGIQGKGSILIKQIEGCYFNVVGLPLNKISEMLEDMGEPVYKFW